MKIYTDPNRRQFRLDAAKFASPDDTYRRPFAWTIATLNHRPTTPNWAKRRYWEALSIATNYCAAFTPITER